MLFPISGRRRAALLLSLSLLAGPVLARRAAPPPGRGYTGALTLDVADGRVLFEDNADAVSPPASMAKLMTFAVLHDKLADGSLTLATPVTVEAADSRIGGTQVWLKEREVFPVEELIYAMMIQSANDAAHALARASAGSAEAFVDLMNAKARALGMTRTAFRTPHGLPPTSRRTAEGDLTTPRDFARLCRHLLLNTDVLRYTSVKTRPFGATRPVGPVVMNNHNHLLGKVQGLDGLKTGFTNGAGFCLSATALRQGRRILVVALGGENSKSRDLKVAELLNRGFATLPALAPADAGAPETLPVGQPPRAPAGATLPVVRTHPPEQDSTAAPPPVTFRVIPPGKSP